MKKTTDERMVELLFEGYLEKEIPAILKQEGIKPNSLSIIEKKLKALRAKHKVKTMFRLGVELYRLRILNSIKD